MTTDADRIGCETDVEGCDAGVMIIVATPCWLGFLYLIAIFIQLLRLI